MLEINLYFLIKEDRHFSANIKMFNTLYSSMTRFTLQWLLVMKILLCYRVSTHYARKSFLRKSAQTQVMQECSELTKEQRLSNIKFTLQVSLYTR